MPADDPSSGGHPGAEVSLRDVLVARVPAVAALARSGPLALGAAVCALAVLGALTWWLVRPAPHPAIETVLPMAAGASGAAPRPSSSGGAGSTGATGAPLVVHVVGAVNAPGVVRLAAGARTLDAVAAAGGAAPDADLARVNLAAKVADGQRVAVPRLGEPAPPGVAAADDSTGARGAPSVDAPLDLNEATEAQLDLLPGVGPATAAAIVAHRTANGPFRSVDALGDVRGIGPAKLEQLRPLLTVAS